MQECYEQIITCDGPSIVNAYRSWKHLLRSKDPYLDDVVVIDDLCDLPAVATLSSIEACIKLMEIGLESRSNYDAISRLKFKNSLAFAKCMGSSPSTNLLKSMGAVLIHVSDEDIESLSEQVKRTEEFNAESFPEPAGDAIEHVGQLLDSAFTFLKSKASFLKNYNVIYDVLEENSPFNGKVVTDQEGKIVVKIARNPKFSPALVLNLIHEVIGHVLHFTQLRGNERIQRQYPYLLCLSLHTHEAFFVEAIAQLITRKILLSDWAFEGKEHVLSMNLKHERTMALLHKLLPLVIDGYISARDAAIMHHRYAASNVDVSFLESRYNAEAADVFRSRVYTNYFPSMKCIKPLLELDDYRFYEVFNSLLTEYFTPETLANFVSESTRNR